MKNINFTVILAGSILLGVGLFAGLIFYIKSHKTSEIVELPIVLEEFSDFQCPACKAYHPIVQQILSEFSEDELTFKYRHFPLINIHPNAYNSAVASEAAREQGKFTEYGDLLFENQDKLNEEDLVRYAEQLELDIDKFNTDRKNPDIIARVDNDLKEAESRNFNSTPTFALDGKRLSIQSNPETELRKAIQKRIDLAKSN